MSNPFYSADSLDPSTSSLQSPSVAQAANDLRIASGEKARELVHTAEEKATALKERAIESAIHFRDSATEKAATLKAAATDKAHHLKESATEQWQDTSLRAQELHETAENYVRLNPTKCVLGALGVGFLIGLIARR